MLFASLPTIILWGKKLLHRLFRGFTEISSNIFYTLYLKERVSINWRSGNSTTIKHNVFQVISKGIECETDKNPLLTINAPTLVFHWNLLYLLNLLYLYFILNFEPSSLLFWVLLLLTWNNRILFINLVTLESRTIGGVGIIGGLDIVIVINNRRGWNNRGGWPGLKKQCRRFLSTYTLN